MATIIAELCQNHSGDRKLLSEMIHAVAEAGADFAKVQTIRVRDLTRRQRFEEGIVENGVKKAIKRPYAPEYERLSPLELAADDEAFFREECKRFGTGALTSVFSRASVEDIAKLGYDRIKVPSYDCASLPLLRQLVGRFSHIYVSTGATFDDEIAAAAKVLAASKFTFLHCVTIYPTPLDQMHLARLQWLRQFSPSVGFSDHSLVARDGLKASIGALALGADVIERHFRTLPADKTKDGPVSIDPKQLAELVRWARAPQSEVQDYVAREIPERDAMFGSPVRALSAEELLNRDYYRGRFASPDGKDFIYNWEDKPLP